MLQCLNRYNRTTFNKKIANIFFHKSRNHKYTRKIYTHIFRKGVIFGYTTLLRKSFFRSILMYTNFQYANLNYTPEINVFYYPKLVLTYTTTKHDGFLPKKRFIK